LKHIPTNPGFAQVDRPLTKRTVAATYNNFYEFGGVKSIWKAAQDLPTDPWRLEVGGLVKYPQVYDLGDLYRKFALEERIYRFRCVEAWSMVLPWLGFPMAALINMIEPASQAKFARFTSYYDPQITLGPSLHLGSLRWPYTEGLTLAEMANELTFLPLASMVTPCPSSTERQFGPLFLGGMGLRVPSPLSRLRLLTSS